MDNATFNTTANFQRQNNFDNIEGLDNGPGTAFVLVFFSILGLLGNLLIIISVAIDKTLRSYTDVFIVNVACMDLIITSVIIPSMVPLLLASKNIYPDALCQAFGLLTTLLCTGSLVSLTVLAVNRYIFICHRSIYSRAFNKVSVFIMVLGIWLYALLITLPTVLGWGAVGYRAPAALCCYNHTASLSHLIFVTAAAISVPMTVTYSCYGRIAYTIYKSQKKVAAHNSSQKSTSSRKKYQIFTMFIVSALFTLSWFPYCLTAILEHVMQFSPIVIRIAGWMGMFNSCINSLILGIVNKNYRKAYFKVMCCGKKWTSGTEPVTMAVTVTDHE